MLPLLVLLSVAPSSQDQKYVSVTTSRGTVQGTRVDYGNNKNNLYYGNADAYLGLPYAAPPVQQNRFQPPQQPAPFNGVYDATYLRGRCPQPGTSPGPVSEDCLYLNVFTQNTGNSTLQAVMVFIEGNNGFTTGGADMANIPGTVRNLVTRGVVVVVIQYRLGALGFMAAPNSGIPANLGMLDQVQALQWVRSEISHFGGDPNRITVAGQGDGACAVSALTLSPMANNLFQQGILQSGTIYSCYGADQPPVYTQNNNGPQYDNGGMGLSNGPNQGYNPNTQGYNQNTQGYPPNQQYPQQNQGGPQNQYPNQNQGNPNQNQGYPQQNGGGFGPQNQGYPQQNGGGFGPQNQGYPQSNDIGPSQQLAMQLCNITAAQWNSGQLANLRPCLLSLSVDVFIQIQGNTVSKWLIVRDNQFLPGSPDQLPRANIPLIIGTVQDEDADYAFKMVNSGQATGMNEQQLYNTWFVDYAKQQHIGGQTAQQVQNIIASNYGVYNNSQGPPGGYNPNGQGSSGYQPTSQSPPNNGGYNQNTPGYLPSNQNQGFSTTTYQTITQGYNNGPNGGNQYANNGYNNQNQYNPSGNGYPNNNGNGNGIGFPGGNANGNNGNNNGYPSNSNTVAPYNPPPPPSQQTIQALQIITQISSDANGVSQSVQEVMAVQQTGTSVRIFQFTHVSQLGRSNVPNLSPWQPVFRGQDQVFLFMSETIWQNGNPTQDDFRAADQIGSKWTEFAQTGQVSGWQPTQGNNYNYCNLNSSPSYQPGYAAQARRVFNGQVDPLINQYHAAGGSDGANVVVHSDSGPQSWSIAFSLPNLPNLPW